MSDTAAHCITATAGILAIAAVLVVCLCTNHDGTAIIALGLTAISGLGGFLLGRISRPKF